MRFRPAEVAAAEALWASLCKVKAASVDAVEAQQALYQAMRAACGAQLLPHDAAADLLVRAQEVGRDAARFALWLPQAVQACVFLGASLGVEPRLQAAMPARCFSCPSVEAMLGEPALKRVAWSTLKGMLAVIKGQAL